MRQGFIAMSRASLDHHLLQDAERFRAWFWLVAQATWKAIPFSVSGKTITLERGQLCASVRQMADAWGWSKSAVDRFLTRLETETMIEREAGHGRLVITICNYEKYQDDGNSKRDSSGTPSGTAAGQQRDNKEQDNHKTSVKRERNARAIPDDWQPSEFGIGTKSRAIVDRMTEDEFNEALEHFLAHHRKKGDKFKDWQAAWSTWILNSKRFGNGKAGFSNRERDTRDGVAKALDRQLGLGEPSREVERRSIGGSEGGGERALPRPGSW